jgi:PadR family transcriptional regulator, regulatory protein PadR
MTRVAKAWMRGAGPLAVLTLLDRREMYGYELAEALDRESEGVLAMGHSTLYPLLYNLESKGLIERHDRRAQDSARVRKYYRVTAQGRAWLRKRQAEWAGLVEAMGRMGLA